MKLSILICSLYKRAMLYKKLFDNLLSQKSENIEILTIVDNGTMKVGTKRNKLLSMARGEYVSFCDDDDNVSNFYIQSILKAVETKPDCVGITGIITFDGKNPKKFIHSIRYSQWSETTEAYLRYPNHLNPVKKEIALKSGGFPEIDYGEDKIYSDRIKPLLKTEIMIEEPIYFYQYSETNSETNKKK